MPSKFLGSNNSKKFEIFLLSSSFKFNSEKLKLFFVEYLDISFWTSKALRELSIFIKVSFRAW